LTTVGLPLAAVDGLAGTLLSGHGYFLPCASPVFPMMRTLYNK
jgi:hypothetical protein